MEPTTFQPGSREDFDRLYRQSYRRIVATLMGVLGGDLSAAEDCAQEAFERAYKAWARWRPDAPAEAWLHRIAINAATSYRRRERLRQVGEVVRRLGRPGPGADPSEVATGSVAAALRRLPVDQAALVVLRHHHGFSNREIAASLGVPETTLGSRLQRAMARLREELTANDSDVVREAVSGVVSKGAQPH